MRAVSSPTGGLRDARAREDVEQRLGDTLFVEAGAGSGKTTALVARIVRLICSGRCELEQLAAVTFTEAAAAELRVRIRRELAAVANGVAAGAPPATDDERRRARKALDHIDEAAVSTIHGFCQRLLAEHPIEAGLPPRFEVLDEVRQSLEWRHQWSDALDAFEDDAGARGVFQAASLMSVTRIEQLARDVVEEWDRCGTGPFDGLAAVQEVERIVTAGTAAVIDRLGVAFELAGACSDPADRLALRLAKLRALRGLLVSTTRWEDQLAALVAEDRFGGQIGSRDSWACDVDAVRTALRDAGDARDGTVQACSDAVLPALVAMADELARSLAAKRRAAGRLTFHDLLVIARDLLAGQPGVLASIRNRLRYLLVDEFQDTDPLQLEIAELIAFGTRPLPESMTVLGQEVSLAPLGSADFNAASTDPVPADDDAGRLFLVGDPQQSIYRFRGADLGAYVAARERHAGGGVATLSSNFRSVPGILEFVNECFSSILGEGYSRLDAVRPDAGSGSPVSVVGKPFAEPKLRRFAQREIESQACARAIERAVLSEQWQVEDSGGFRPARFSDVAILVPRRTGLDQIEAALDAHDIGYRVESASLIFRSQEVRNLLALCRAIDAPGDELALVAALRSPAFGCGDDDLRAYRALEGRWSIERPTLPAEIPPEGEASLGGDEGKAGGHGEKAGGHGEKAGGDDGKAHGDASIVAEALVRLASFRARRHELGAVGTLELAVRDRRLLQLAATTPRVRESWRRVRFLLEQARAFVSAGGGGLSEFADWVDEQLSEGLRAVESVLPEPDEDVVHILTVHGAKGLEFPITVLAGFGTSDVLYGATGPRVLRGAGGVEVRFRKGKLETSGYGRLFAEEQLHDQEEAIRVLYVAATRARDHLIFCAHHLPPASGTPSLGQTLYEAAVVASKDHPAMCEFLDLSVPDDLSMPAEQESVVQDAQDAQDIQGTLFSLDMVPGAVPNGSGADAAGAHDAARSGGAARTGVGDAGAGAAGARHAGAAHAGAAAAGAGAAGARHAGAGHAGEPAQAVPSESVPIRSAPLRAVRLEVSQQAYLSWKQAREELLARIGRPSSILATEVGGLADAEAGVRADRPPCSGGSGEPAGPASPGPGLGGPSSAPLLTDVPGRISRRPARRIGRAVHGTLQLIGREAALAVGATASSDNPEFRRVATAQARAEGIAEHAGEVEQLARAALSSPTVRSAFASPTLRRELYVSTKIGGVVLEGFIDLCFEDERGLVVVDYKTYAQSELGNVAAYELQVAAYALALEAATGKKVSRCVLIFARSLGAIEHEVKDLARRIAEIVELVGASAVAPAPGRS